MENKEDILNELQALSPALAALEKVNVFTIPAGYFDQLSGYCLLGVHKENQPGNGLAAPVPAGYFDNLAATVLDQLKMQTEAVVPELLTSIAPANVFEVPGGYFDSVAASVMARIQAGKEAVAETRALSPVLDNIGNKNVYEIPAGYFEELPLAVMQQVSPKAKVVSMPKRSNFFKYAVAAAFTGAVALGVFKFTGSPAKTELPAYVTAGLQVQDVDQELAKIADDDIVKYLEANGTDVKTAMVANSVEDHELPAQEDYLLDEKALDTYLNSINVNDLKN